MKSIYNTILPKLPTNDFAIIITKRATRSDVYYNMSLYGKLFSNFISIVVKDELYGEIQQIIGHSK